MRIVKDDTHFADSPLDGGPFALFVLHFPFIRITEVTLFTDNQMV